MTTQILKLAIRQLFSSLAPQLFSSSATFAGLCWPLHVFAHQLSGFLTPFTLKLSMEDRRWNMEDGPWTMEHGTWNMVDERWKVEAL